MLLGITADEESAMRTTYGAGDLTSFQALMASTFGASAYRFSNLYAAATDRERALASKQLLRDRGLAAPYIFSRHRTECGRDGLLEILGEASVPVEPCQSALNHPATGQHLEALGGVGSLDDLDGPFADAAQRRL